MDFEDVTETLAESFEGGISDESESLYDVESETFDESTSEPVLESDLRPVADFLGYAYIVESPQETTEEETPASVQLMAFEYDPVSRHEVYGSYALLTIGNYEFPVPAAVLDRLVIDTDNTGHMVIYNNSGSTITLQGMPNFTTSNATSCYQLTIPATNYASSIYNNRGYAYISTYSVTANTLRTTNNYLSGTIAGTLDRSTLAEDYTSAPAFYSYVQSSLFLIMAFLMGLFFKWRVKHDRRNS